MERIYLSKITVLLILLVAVVAFLFGAYVHPIGNIDSTELGAARNANSTNGRFTIAISPLVKTEKFLLDTQTGKIWQLVKPGDLPDKSFRFHRLAVSNDEIDHFSIVDEKHKVSLKLPNDKYGKIAKDKLKYDRNLAEKGPTDKVSIEIIKSGTVSIQQVPRETKNSETVSVEKELSADTSKQYNFNQNNMKAISRNTLSAKAPTQTNL